MRTLLIPQELFTKIFLSTKNLAKFGKKKIYLATKPVTRKGPRDNIKPALREVFRQKFGLYDFLLSTLADSTRAG